MEEVERIHPFNYLRFLFGPFSHQIGTSTTRLHAYGQMGAEAPTIECFVLRGDRQVRHAESSIRR